jgi:hypothetical protein
MSESQLKYVNGCQCEKLKRVIGEKPLWPSENVNQPENMKKPMSEMQLMLKCVGLQ